MKLKKILKEIPQIQVKGSKEIEISGISSNSKLVKKKLDYRKFIRNSGSIKKSRISLNSKKSVEVSIVNKVKVFSTNFKKTPSYLGVSWNLNFL